MQCRQIPLSNLADIDMFHNKSTVQSWRILNPITTLFPGGSSWVYSMLTTLALVSKTHENHVCIHFLYTVMVWLIIIDERGCSNQ